MALFLRVEAGEREREREREKERGRRGREGGEHSEAERRDCPMLVGMVTWPGEREPGKKEGEGAFVSWE